MGLPADTCHPGWRLLAPFAAQLATLRQRGELSNGEKVAMDLSAARIAGPTSSDKLFASPSL